MTIKCLSKKEQSTNRVALCKNLVYLFDLMGRYSILSPHQNTFLKGYAAMGIDIEEEVVALREYLFLKATLK